MRRIVNVLVVALIVVVASCLLLPAIARVRESQRRMECQNNLREHGLAVHNYHGAFARFPPATVANKQLPPEKRLSWLVVTLPYTTQVSPVLDMDNAWDADENLEPKERGTDGHNFVIGELPFDLCPGNTNRSAPGRPGLTHYVGLAGIGHDAAATALGYPEEGLIDRDIGFFGYDRQIALQDIKDGTSTTLMMVETAWDNGPWTAGGQATVRGLDPSAQPYAGRGRQFGGSHPGGMNALFADGHIQFVKDSVDPHTLEALATIAGGEEVGKLEGN